MRPTFRIPLVATLFISVHAALFAANGVTTVTYAKTHGSYRHSAAKAETYVLSEGHSPSVGGPNASVAAVPFGALSDALETSLSGQGFLPAANPGEAKLLLVVHRGITHPLNGEIDLKEPAPPPAGVMTPPIPANPMLPSGSMVAGVVEQRTAATENRTTSALVLGYFDEYRRLTAANRVVGTENLLEDLMQELDEPRFYIVVAAYDNRVLQKTGRRVLLWETRVSFRADRTSFAQAYASVLASAARSFGRTTSRLDRRFVQLDAAVDPDARRLADARF